MYRLSNTVMDYAWGSPTALPQLLGTPSTGRPQAELWIGAHPAAPSRLADDPDRRTLTELIAADPAHHLGPAWAAPDAQLPFLLKLLAADQPLSIQVHPDRDQARAGFDREIAQGIPLDSPHRNYRDRNHKPEIICALTPFAALCGWRAPAASAHVLASLGVPELQTWADHLLARAAPQALREVLTQILDPHNDQSRQAAQAVTRALPERALRPGPLQSVWAALAPAARAYPDDPGLVVALLLNQVRLKPGQALYLDARRPHAYLRGTGVELMASSDNVLRCGLTAKHVDAAELMTVVDFAPSAPQPLSARQLTSATQDFCTPSADFRLLRHLTGPGAERISTGAPRLLLATEGRSTLELPGEPPLVVSPGDAVFVPAAQGPLTLTGAPSGIVFHATLPMPG